MHNYKQLKVWEKSIDLVVAVYEATTQFPTEEKYGLTSQMRRSAVSVPSNIAEGAGRNSDMDFCRFLSIAHGSSYELETQVIVSEKLSLLSKEVSEEICTRISEIQKMNYNLQLKLNPQIFEGFKS